MTSADALRDDRVGEAAEQAGALQRAGVANQVDVGQRAAVPAQPTPDLRALVIDWGGVLTAPLDQAMVSWARQDNVDFEHFRDVMRQWVELPGAPQTGAATAAQGPQPLSPVHALERGQLSPEEFERTLAAELASRGSIVMADGLLNRILSGLHGLSEEMLNLVRHAHQAGLRTALLSNSWGNDYPEHAWAGAFDAVVISGRVGMRKPDPEIYRHTAELLGLRPEQCVMVDDLPQNVRGAVAAGMVAVLHRSYEETADELEAIFNITLRSPLSTENDE